MRPIRRNTSPQNGDFIPYSKAKDYLVRNLGTYCSYCERYIPYSALAIEHIQAKQLPQYSHLEGSWTNFLLSCVNCNSTKGIKDVTFDQYLLPDRDNTFLAFEYFEDGNISPREGLNNIQEAAAINTIELVGLSKHGYDLLDDNGKQIIIDRISFRKETWLTALEARREFDDNDNNVSQNYLNVLQKLFLSTGGFSIWMKVFDGIPAVQCLIINSFPSTNTCGCFDMISAVAHNPHPNDDLLEHGSKI